MIDHISVFFEVNYAPVPGIAVGLSSAVGNQGRSFEKKCRISSPARSRTALRGGCGVSATSVGGGLRCWTTGKDGNRPLPNNIYSIIPIKVGEKPEKISPCGNN
jgi:hypothetical protein